DQVARQESGWKPTGKIRVAQDEGAPFDEPQIHGKIAGPKGWPRRQRAPEVRMRVVDLRDKTDQLLLIGKAVRSEAEARDGIREDMVPVVRIPRVIGHDVPVWREVLDHIPEAKQCEQPKTRVGGMHGAIGQLVIERWIVGALYEREIELAVGRDAVC